MIKIPRWTFEKFPDADETLTTQMKSVGEAMAIGRTFKEALQKGIRSMEVKRFGFGLDKYDKWLNAQKGGGVGESSGDAKAGGGSLPPTARAGIAPDDDDKTTQGESAGQEWPIPTDKLRRKLAVPSQGRLYYIRYAMKMGWTIEQIHELTNIDPWFLGQMRQLVEFEPNLATGDNAEKFWRRPSSGATATCRSQPLAALSRARFRPASANGLKAILQTRGHLRRGV